MNKARVGFDLGTTSLIARLWDETGQLLAEAVCDNPQRSFGADVIARMEAAQKGAGEQLQQQLVAGINNLLQQLFSQSGCCNEQVCFAAAAANPAISHFLAGREIDSILAPPHRLNYSAGEFLEFSGLDIDLPGSLYLLPLVSAYVGGDLLAVLLGTPPMGLTLYVDLGTNAEIALWDGQHWQVTSVAAGSAFEAGSLTCGMRYAHGAVSDVALVKNRFALTVAGGGVPKGICGSGLFALISCAVQAGLIAVDGRIKSADEIESNLSRYLVVDGEGNALQLYRDARTWLLLTQGDVRTFQLAKGAVLAGVDCLLQRAGLAAEQLDAVNITGAFGGALPVSALKRVAILPEIMLEKSRFLPAGVLEGLQHLQADQIGCKQAEELALQLKAYPLSGTPAFEKAFLASLDFS